MVAKFKDLLSFLFPYAVVVFLAYLLICGGCAMIKGACEDSAFLLQSAADNIDTDNGK